jgi:hypothetical protein
MALNEAFVALSVMDSPFLHCSRSSNRAGEDSTNIQTFEHLDTRLTL